MIFVFYSDVIDSKLLYRHLKTSCSLSFMYPLSFINSEKTYLSARMLRQEILSLSGYLCMAYWSFLIRVKIAYIWNVKPHLLGYLQYFSSMLIFFPPRFCQSSTGYSIHLASGMCCLRISRKVDFPHPIFPSIVKQNWLELASGLIRSSVSI